MIMAKLVQRQMSKSEPKIEDIKITKKDLDEIKSLLKSSGSTTESKNRIIKKYAGGVCMSCGNVPNKMLIHDADGATVIERYCNKCFQKWKRHN